MRAVVVLIIARQVQDLQNQLADAKHQINQLKSLLQNTPGNPEANGLVESHAVKLPALHGSRTESLEKRGPPAMHNFDHVRRNLRKYSRGVFKIPPTHRPVTATPLINSPEPAVPPIHVVESLLANYYVVLHRAAPMFHWPGFIEQWEKVKAAGTFIGTPQIWVGLLFGVMACGTLQPTSHSNPDVEGMRFIIVAARLLNTWTDNLLTSHVQTGLLMSIFLYEQNIRSAGWVWLGTTVNMAAEIGLELEVGPWTPLEAEGRKRLFWAIVAWDR
jgi:hypothetical protein